MNNYLKRVVQVLFIGSFLGLFLPFIKLSCEGGYSDYMGNFGTYSFSGFEIILNSFQVSLKRDGFAGKISSIPQILLIIVLILILIGFISSLTSKSEVGTKITSIISTLILFLFRILTPIMIKNSIKSEAMGGEGILFSADQTANMFSITFLSGWYVVFVCLLLIAMLALVFDLNLSPTQYVNQFNSPSNANDTMGIMQQKVQAASQNIAEQFNALKPNPSPSQFTASLIWETSNKRINKHMAEEALSLACKEFHLDYELLDEFNKKELHSGNSLYYRKVLVFSQNQMKLSSSFSNYFQEYYYRNMFKQVLKEG